MAFELIREPSPGQQLFALVSQLRQQWMARREQDQNLARQNAYLKLHQQQASQEDAYRQASLGLRREELVSQGKERDVAQAHQAQLDAYNAQQDRLAERHRQIAEIRGGVPDHVTLSADLAGRIADNPALAYKIPGLTARAQEQSRQGLQGSAVRAPVLGSAGGVTYDPGTRNLNLPSGGGASGRLPERQMRQSADTFSHALDLMEELERNDPTASQYPTLAAGIEGAGSIPVVGGAIRGFLGPTGQRQLTANQVLYRKYLKTAVDHYIGALRIRATNQVMNDLREAIAPSAGQTSPLVQAGTSRMRAYLRQRVHQTAYPDEPGMPEATDQTQSVDDLLEALRARP